MAELSTKQKTEAAFKALDDATLKILELPLEEVPPYIPVVRQAGVHANETARAEILDLDARHDAWRERALAAEKKLEPTGQPSSPKPSEPAKPQLRPLTDIRVDPNFSPSKIGGDAGRWLQHVDEMMTAERRKGSKGHTHACASRAFKEEVGRFGAYHHDSLEPDAMMYGAPWHLDEAVRQSDLFFANLVPFIYTINGKKVTILESNWDGLSKDQWNDKEDDHVVATVEGWTHAMWANLEAHPENLERVKRGDEWLLSMETKWLWRKGNNTEWRIPLDRVNHPFGRRLLTLIRRLRREKNPITRTSRPEMVKEYQRLIDKAIPQYEAEFFYHTEGGVETLHWAYNVLAVTDKGRDVKVGSDAHITDAFQLYCYCIWVSQITFMLGLYGVGIFKTKRFQRAMSNTIYFCGLSQGPYNYTVFEDGELYTGSAFSNADCGPRSTLWLDNRTTRPKPVPMQNEYQRRIFTKNTELRKGGSFRQKVPNVEGFPHMAQALFASPEYVAFSEEEMFGSAERPLMKSHSHLIFTPAARAFAEGYKALGYEHFQ